jgi:hypothetical protein
MAGVVDGVILGRDELLIQATLNILDIGSPESPDYTPLQRDSGFM